MHADSTNHISFYSVYRSRPRPGTWSRLLVTTLKNYQLTREDLQKRRLCAKKKAMSVIWNYFGYKKDDIDQTCVLCRQCLASVATTRRNTTNLFDHLRQYHTAQYNECKARSDCRPKQKSILVIIFFK